MAGSPGDVRAGGAFVEIYAKDGPFAQGLARVQAKMRAFGDVLRKAGTGMFLGGTAIGIPLMLAAKSAATFEDTLLGMRAAAGLSAEDVAKVEKEALKLSQSMGVAPAKIGGAFLELLKAGMTMEQVLGGAGQSAVEFARVSGVAMDEAAVFMKVAMNSFGVSATEAVDTLSAAADASETSIASMVESFALVGSAGALWNQSLFDISQGLSALARFGIKGEEAGTGIKTMLMRLTSPTRVAEEALAQLGLTVNSFRDADGKLLPLAQVVDILAKSMNGIAPALRDRLLGDIFGDRGIRVVGAFIQVGQAGFNSIKEAMQSNLPVAAKFQILMSGISGGFEKIGAAVQRLSFAFASALGDSLGNAVAGLVKMIDAVTAFVTAFPFASKLVAGVTAGIFALGVAAIVGSYAIKIMAAGLGLLPAILTAIMSPIGAVLFAIAGIGTAAVIVAREISPGFRREFDAIAEAAMALDFSKAWDLLVVNLAIALMQAQQSVEQAMDAISNTVSAAGAYMWDSVLEGWDRFLGFFGADIIWMNGQFEKLGAIFGSIWENGFGWATDELDAKFKEIDARVARERGGSTFGSRSLARTNARQVAANDRQDANDQRDRAYQQTVDELRRERDRIKNRGKEDAAAKNAVKPSDFREPGAGVSAGAAGGFGKSLGTFASEIAGQIGVGPELNAMEQTAENTRATAQGVEDLKNAVDFGRGGQKDFNPADLQQALAGVERAMQAAPPPSAEDKELVNAAEKTAVASEKQVALLERMLARSTGGGRLQFS